MAKLSFAPEADDDLDRIWTWGAEVFGEAQADAYFFSLFDAAERLAEMPGIGRRPLPPRPDFHVHPVGSHVMIYRENEHGIDVIRVLAMRQNWPSLLADIGQA